MKKATKLTAAALAATLSLSLAACGSSASTGTASTSASADGVVYRTLDEIKADGTINIGVFSDKNPFGYVDENGEYQGYDIYFANRLAEDLGVKVNTSPPRPPTASSTSRPARSMSFWPTSRSRRSAPRRSILRCPT